MEFSTTPRIIIFVLSVLALIGLEYVISRRPRNKDLKRLGLNLSLGIVGILVIRILAPLSLMHAAFLTQDRHIGLLNWLALAPLSLPLGFILFDLLLYWQHRLFHEMDFFWQFHKLHHQDEFLDISSGIRFHPIEFLLSYGLKLIFIICFGLGPWTVLFCEIWLSSMSLFTHANLRIPMKLDIFLKRYIVTPNYHYVHHSTAHEEMNSNYCNGISLWDRMFNSYSPSDEERVDQIKLGVSQPDT
ncbi:MAG: sterol desaturase [Bdellovibrionales bacterium CG12_big_fil_rev_8_21_14_0_65_38_15]|nr:MAG: sterol desaturase [Bdellovibrionales bacterium CG22_combo_CG10-13_8_21_14_all_38_13]PIQ53316.1 MAG: sterol desaturase [Bdellovibrionales bacterium CG12_big_fil_rev_8_21_14_0_65_38_15]PIR30322.1 MAG: sterol desaturase [Bdellovibrionales bacterium CG11_big_fil_rev_8_21_14_0_20_38_13]